MDHPTMTTPLTFRPLYYERPWGGRALERLYGRSLPDADTPIGESWEIVDREDSQSVVAAGPLAGLTLHELWRDHRREIFGESALAHSSPRFPLLIKILDAADTLSIQVHPPASVAAQLGGEPKTEMWFIAEAQPDAVLWVGVTPDVDRNGFEQALASGTVAEKIPRLPVKTGDSIFIPSGRLHAIGAGLVIFEIQQNSDTTYRVFDWNRPGLDGRPRALHVTESLACIDFTDTAPALNPAGTTTLADCSLFKVDHHHLAPDTPFDPPGFRLVGIVTGTMEINAESHGPGTFCLIPASRAADNSLVAGSNGASFLEISLP